MPKILERLVSQLRAKNYSKSSAYAVATNALQKSGNLKPGTAEPTAKGIRRGNMGAAKRAKDRAARYGNGAHKTNEYSYSSKTNRATLRSG
jgi:hypothetical protein